MPKDRCGEWRYGSSHSYHRCYRELRGQLHAPAALTPRIEPQLPMNMTASCPELSRGCGEKWDLLLEVGVESRTVRPIAQSLSWLSYSGFVSRDCVLMFFWPCIMNWLYTSINYQLYPLIIIYSQNIILLYMFRVSSAHLQEDTVVYMQHMLQSLSMRVPGGLSVHRDLCQHKNKIWQPKMPKKTQPYATE